MQGCGGSNSSLGVRCTAEEMLPAAGSDERRGRVPRWKRKTRGAGATSPTHLRSRLVTINSGAGSITADGRRDAGFRAGESEPTSITSSASDAMAQVIAASGVKVLAVGAFNVSLVGMVVDRDQYEESNRNRQQTVSTIVENPSVVWDAIKQPYVEDHSNHSSALLHRLDTWLQMLAREWLSLHVKSFTTRIPIATVTEMSRATALLAPHAQPFARVAAAQQHKSAAIFPVAGRLKLKPLLQALWNSCFSPFWD